MQIWDAIDRKKETKTINNNALFFFSGKLYRVLGPQDHLGSVDPRGILGPGPAGPQRGPGSGRKFQALGFAWILKTIFSIR